MSCHSWNWQSSSSAARPDHHSEDSTAEQPHRSLRTGWGNDYQSDDRRAQHAVHHSDDSSAERPAGELIMSKGVSLKWTTSPSKWRDDSPICAEHLDAAPLMQLLAASRTTLREIPWRGILEHVLTTGATYMSIPFDTPDLMSVIVETAGIATLEHLALYLRDWRASSVRVQAVLDWHFSPKEMCERSRTGAFLADCMITELKVREHGARASVLYHVVGNGAYKAIGHEMGIVQHGNSSANNVGNQLECLCWVAFEENRPLWIIALVWHALQLELTWCSRKKFKSSAAVTAATEADELFCIRSDSHPSHETQAYWEERSHIPALTALEAGHFHIARGMVYEANVSPAGAVPKPKAASMGQSAEESAAPAPPPKAKLPDSAWLRIANDPWRAKGIALPWREDHPQRPPPRAEPSAPSSSSTAKPPAPDDATPPFLKPKPKTKSNAYADWRVPSATESDSDAHPVHETQADRHEHPAAKIRVTELDSTDPLQPIARTPEPDCQKSACRAKSQPYKPAAKSAAQPLSPSDLHPVNSTSLESSTPLWYRFMEKLQLASGGENGDDFVNFIQYQCFQADHFFKDSYGNPVDTKIPLAVKMESLFQTAWHRRKLALERLRQNGMTVNDETYELNDDDMRTLPQLQLPERCILIVCAMGGGLGYKTGAS